MLWGFYYEEGTDSIWNATVSPLFKDQAEHILNTFGFHYGTSHILKWLYGLDADINWYGWMIVGLQFLAFWNLWVWYVGVRDRGSVHWGIWGLGGVVCGLLLLNHFVLVQISRTAFLLSASSLLVLIDLYRDSERRLSGAQVVWQHFLFLMGILARPEPVYLVVGIIGGYYVLLGEWQRWKGVVGIWIPVLGACILMGLLLNVPFDQQDRDYLAFRPYQFTLWDFEQEGMDLALENRQDSVIYKAAKLSFLSDKKHINLGFFERIGLRPLDKSPAYLLNYVQDWRYSLGKLRRVLGHYGTRYQWLVIGMCLLGLLSIVWGGVFWGRMLLFQLFFWGTIMVLAAFMKLEDRAFVPLLSIYGMLNLGVLMRAKGSYRLGRGIVLGIVLVLLLIDIQFFHQRWSYKVNRAYYFSLLKEELRSMPARKLVMDLRMLEGMFIGLPDRDGLGKQHSYYSVDNGIMYFYASYDRYMKSAFGGDDLGEIYLGMKATKESLLFVSHPSRMALFAAYMEAVYGETVIYKELPAQFHAVYEADFPRPPYEMRFYELE